MKTGLVMEGGSMRGMFTAGVTDVMMENGIDFDGAIGVSAGAVFGCNFKSKQPGRAIRYNMKYCNDRRYGSFHSLLKTGDYFGNEFCYTTLPTELDVFDTAAFKSSKLKFYVVATDVETGKAIYKKIENGDKEDLQWFRASASMPLMSQIVNVGGYKLLDGGIADSVPIQYFESIGYDKNVVILTQPKGFVKQRNKFIPAVRRALKDYPNVVDTLAHRHEEYNETIKYIEQKEENGEILVIRPKEALNISAIVHDPRELKRVYDLGREVGIEMLPKLREFLA